MKSFFYTFVFYLMTFINFMKRLLRRQKVCTKRSRTPVHSHRTMKINKSGRRHNLLCNQLRQAAISLSYLISSYLILSHLILSYLILSHLISSYLISSYLILSHLISSYLILSYLILSHLILSYLSYAFIFFRV